MREMDRWLKKYELMRTSDGQSKALLSSRFDLEGLSWSEIREIPIPQLECNFGVGCEMLRKSWFAYRMTKRNGGYAADVAFRINKIQHNLGFPITEFEELDQKWVEQELSMDEMSENYDGEYLTAEEIQLRKEEMWNDSETSEPEDPEYVQLRREEREDLLNQLG